MSQQIDSEIQIGKFRQKSGTLDKHGIFFAYFSTFLNMNTLTNIVKTSLGYPALPGMIQNRY